MEQQVPFYNGTVEPNCDYHHGQIPLLPGVKCYQITRANRAYKELADGTTSTYKHGADLTYFHGKFYVQYLCNPKDEHYEAGYSVLASSSDGKKWNKFQISFPEYLIPACILTDYKGIVHEFDGTQYAFMHQRMSFYRSSSNRMLVLGFYGYCPEKWMTNWDNYGIGRVVRELYADGTMSDIYFIRPNFQAGWTIELLNYPMYDKCLDEGFVKACEELLATPLVTQQWAEENGDADDIISIKHPKGKTYQAFCSYHIDENNVIGLWKHSYTARSVDGGKTFGDVTFSPSLVMSGQKIWGEKMKNGNFMLSYIPTLESQHRYPLCAVTSKDGICFDDMRLIHGEVPTMRYGGFWKDFGAQYMRGISEGHTTKEDHPDETYTYLVYSMNKEDIWIAHIPVNAWSNCLEEKSLYEKCNIYQPKWSNIEAINDTTLALEECEPVDYVHLQYALKKEKKKTVSFSIKPIEMHEKGLYIEFRNERHQPAVRLVFRENGVLYIRTTAEQGVCKYKLGQQLHISITMDCTTFKSNLLIQDVMTGETLVSREDRFLTAVREIAEVGFRSGAVRRTPTLETDPDLAQDLDRTMTEQKGKRFACEIANIVEE